MKKLLAIILIVTMVSASVMGCSGGSEKEGGEEAKGTIDEALSEKLFADIEPLEAETDLTLALSAGATPGFIMWLAGELGAFEKANINAEYVTFANGVVMMEAAASGSWDVGQYGLGGTHTGTISHDVVTFAAGAQDNHSLQVFAPNDSEMVKSGQNTAAAPELYGTKELWEGKDIFLPVGSTLHFAVITGLKHFGLDADSVKFTHMEVPNINTALRAGKCELGGVYGNYTYGDLNEKFTPVLKAADVGCVLYSAIGATKEAYADPEKQKAMQKFLEIYFVISDWLNDEANLDQAAEWYMQWNDREGLKTTKEEITNHIVNNMSYTLQENYDMFNTIGESGNNLMLEYNLEPLKFYVEQGNRTQEDLEKFSKPEFTDAKIVNAIYEGK